VNLDPRIGTTLKGKWRLDAVLGRGGMATVYAATHRNGKRVAVKMLHPELSIDRSVRERFVREGYLANSVGRGAVTVDDDDVTDDDAAFLVMELLEGETLEARRERFPGGRLPSDEVVALMDQVLDTLAAAHAQGIVHRDLKPENLFLTTDGVVKILDFGIARIRDGNASKSATATGSPMGTPAYLPPEQARGEWKNVDARADIWSVGATMFALLTGRCVHEAETVNLLLLAAMTKDAPPLRSIAPDLSAAIAAVVDRALRKDREARWPDARAMQRALRDVLADGENPVSMARRGNEARALAASVSPVGHAATLQSAPGASASDAKATTASTSSRTISPREALGLRSRLVAAGAISLVAAASAVIWLASTNGAAHTAASATTEHSIMSSAALSAPIAAAPAVTPSSAVETTAKPIAVRDLPDVTPTATAGAGPTLLRSTSSAAVQKVPFVAPAAGPSAGKPADPFSARR
jgi:serine/threonine-protein kinase